MACIQSAIHTGRQSSGERRATFKILMFTQTCSLNTQSWASRFASLDTLPRDRIQINTSSRPRTNASTDIHTHTNTRLLVVPGQAVYQGFVDDSLMMGKYFYRITFRRAAFYRRSLPGLILSLYLSWRLLAGLAQALRSYSLNTHLP